MKSKILIALCALLVVSCSGYDEVAKCLTEKDVKMYGAFWCPHCQNQKNTFGSSFEHINYIECSLPDKSGQTEICKQAKVESYPTWEFADGSRVTGVQEIDSLAKKAGCNMGE